MTPKKPPNPTGEKGEGEMKTLAELQEMSRAELFADCREYGWPSEFNHSHNKISRSLIRAMKREHGTVFIWHVNPWRKSDPVVTQYHRGMVYNFQGSFITASYDPDLEWLLRDRLAQPYTGTKADRKMIDIIFNKADELGAVQLVWS